MNCLQSLFQLSKRRIHIQPHKEWDFSTISIRLLYLISTFFCSHGGLRNFHHYKHVQVYIFDKVAGPVRDSDDLSINWAIFVLFAACERADAIARQADVVAALTLEVLKGTTNAFDSGMT